MNEIENVVNYAVNAEVKYVANNQTNIVQNHQLKYLGGNEQINNSYTQSMNQSCCSNNEPIKNVKSYTNCQPQNNINNVKLNTVCVPKTSSVGGICETITLPGQTTTVNNVPGIEYLLHSNINNTSMGNDGSVQHYHQLGGPGHTDKQLNDCVQSYQQLGNTDHNDKNKLSRESMQITDNKIMVSSSMSNNNVAINTLVGTSPVSRELSVQRKPVGIRKPISMREQVSSANNVPGIEYLLHNDMRNPSMINPAYIIRNQQFQNVHVNNIKFNTNMEALTRREYKNEPMPSISTNSVVVVDRTLEVGPAVSRELSVPRKPVGIREPIAMRESVSNPNTVPGIEYLLHNEIPSDNFVKKSRPPKEERPFLCTTCGNKFRQQSHLQQHIRIHTNDRPYQCSFCEKAFKQKSQLNQHERIHTGEKPYKCLICEKAFAQAGQLYSHKKTHGLNINEIKTQRDGREQTPKKRGRRAKEIHTNEVGSPPSVIYIMEPHPRPQRPSTHFQFPRTVNNFRPHMFNNGEMYPSEKLPKIETVVSMGQRPRMPTPSSSISTTAATTTNPQLYHWKHDTSKESHPGT